MIKFVVCPSRAIIPHSVFVRNTVPLKSLGSGSVFSYLVLRLRTIGGKYLIFYGGYAIFIEKYIENTPKVLYLETRQRWI
jgi:hypothetical protein